MTRKEIADEYGLSFAGASDDFLNEDLDSDEEFSCRAFCENAAEQVKASMQSMHDEFGSATKGEQNE